MINPKELRIGNWVDVGEIETLQFQIESIYKDGVNRTETYGYPDEPGGVGPYVDFISFDSINGIPLTPEILEKCGFRKDGHWYGEDEETGKECYFWNNKPITVKMYEDELQQVFIGQEEYPHIKYAHQIQNLYFALTGQELEINP